MRTRTLRTTLARTALPALLAAALLIGCGSDAETSPEDATGSDPAASSAPTPTTDPAPSDGDAEAPVDHEVLALVHETAAGGRTSSMLTLVEDPAELETFTSQFRGDSFAEKIRAAADTSYDGQLWAAVVSVGCDVPPDAFVEEGEAGYLITPGKVVDPLPECLAAVTTVALVAIETS